MAQPPRTCRDGGYEEQLWNTRALDGFLIPLEVRSVGQRGIRMESEELKVWNLSFGEQDFVQG